MTFKKKMTVLLAACLVASTVFGCSADTAVSGGTTSGGEVSSEENGGEESSASEDVTLTFTFWGSTYEKKVIEEALAAFEENSGIQVEGMHIPDDYETKLTAMVAAGNAPDLAYLAIPSAYVWYEDEVLTDLNDIIAADTQLQEDEFLDTAFVYYDEEKIIGLLTAIEGTAIYYNKAMFEEAGVQAPASLEDNWTWEEFVQVAQKLTLDANGKNAADPDFDPQNIVQYGVKWSLGHVTLDALAKNNGASYLAEDGTSGWTSPEMIDVVQKVADLINVYHVMPTKTSGSALPSAEISLQSKKYAMTMEGQWILNNFSQIEDLDVGIAPVPSMGGEDIMVIGSSELAIFEQSAHKQEAWELAKALTDPDESLEVYRDGLWMPIRTAWYEDEELIAQWAGESKARPAGYRQMMLEPVRDNSVYLSELYVKNFNKMWDILNPALDNLWNGEETSAQKVLESIEAELDQVTDGTYGIME